VVIPNPQHHPHPNPQNPASTHKIRHLPRLRRQTKHRRPTIRLQSSPTDPTVRTRPNHRRLWKKGLRVCRRRYGHWVCRRRVGFVGESFVVADRGVGSVTGKWWVSSEIWLWKLGVGEEASVVRWFGRVRMVGSVGEDWGRTVGLRCFVCRRSMSKRRILWVGVGMMLGVGDDHA
jgi:hypothetical protein